MLEHDRESAPDPPAAAVAAPEPIASAPPPSRSGTAGLLGGDEFAPLPAATQSDLGRAYGADLSGVRVAARSPQVGGSTLAETSGTEVHFAPGAYRPGTPGGDWLIAHEVAHVVQQRRGPGGATAARSALEADADHAATAAVSGSRATPLLGAPAGSVQRYEADEHEVLGDAAGGQDVKVTTATGVTLTYGQIIALSGDFYRSPEAVMNAPAGELKGILDVMALEQKMIADTYKDTDKDNDGKLSGENAAELNQRYEAATSGSARAKRHDHAGLDHDHGGHDDHDEDEAHDEHEDHEDHDDEHGDHGDHDEDAKKDPEQHGDDCECGCTCEKHGGGEHKGDMDADQEADDDAAVKKGTKKRRMTKYGPMVGDEHVEDAGEGAKGGTPTATDTFLTLADENSSHFSPENIELNFKPKHNMALDLGVEAYEARTGEKSAGYPGRDDKDFQKKEVGAATSARTGGPSGGAAETGDAPKVLDHQRQATATTVSGADGGAKGEQQAARALMTSGFAAHFLTDAFAGGHLVSGVVARGSAQEWFDQNKPQLVLNLVEQDQEKSRQASEEPTSETVLGAKYLGILSLVDVAGKVSGVLLKILHDTLNESGVMVKNAKGQTWSTTGDGNLRSSPQTKTMAEKSTVTARDKVQDVISTGKTTDPYEALDYVPEVAKLGKGKSWRPIAEAARDKTVYDEIYRQEMLGGPGKARLHTLLANYVTKTPGLLGSMAKSAALRAWEGAKRKGRDLLKWGKCKLHGALDWAKEKAGAAYDKAKDFLGDQWGKLKGWGTDKWEKAKGWGSEQWAAAKAWGADKVDRITEKAQEVKQWGADRIDDVKETAGDVKDWGKDRIDDVRDLVGGASERLASGRLGGIARAAAERARRKVADAKAKGGEVIGEIKSWGADKVEEVKEQAGAAGAVVGGLWASVKKWGADKVEKAIDAARSVKDKVVGGGKDLADKVVAMYSNAKKRAAGFLGDAADWLLGGSGKEGKGNAPTDTVKVDAVQNQTYGHGAFMGAAGAFMKDPKWSAIYQSLMPADYARAAKIAEPDKLQLHMENNPVIAAYGSIRTQTEVTKDTDTTPDAKHKALPMEWDVWLPPDPAKITDPSAVKIAHGNLGTTVAQGVGGKDPVGFMRDDVKNSPSAGQWQELFGKAIALYRGTANDKPPGKGEDAERYQAQLEKLAGGIKGDEATKIAKEFLGADGGLIIDIKSTYSTPADVAKYVAHLKGQGIHVFGVGTFAPAQLEEIPDDVRGVQFFHGLSDLERAASGTHSKGGLKKGQDVSFNAGSLLREQGEGPDGKARYVVDQAAHQRVVAVKRRFDLHVGVYVQEPAVGRSAVQAVTELVNKHAGVYDRGFAYGNISGDAEAVTEGSGMGAQKWMDW